jgi:N-acetylmuramic acid 6-phosphate etherase
MIKLGKTFGNLMVDVQTTNSKLRDRARYIVAQACGISLERSAQILEDCNGEVKAAIVSELAGVSAKQARQLLKRSGGMVRKALSLQPGENL